MFIAKAYAQAGEIAGEVAAMPTGASPMDAFWYNMGLVLVLVVLFYVLLIMPQQKRFKQHAKMLSELEKGDKVITGGGFVATIDKIINDREVVLDLGHGTKVTALRSTISGKNDPRLNDNKADKTDKADKTNKADKADKKKAK